MWVFPRSLVAPLPRGRRFLTECVDFCNSDERSCVSIGIDVFCRILGICWQKIIFTLISSFFWRFQRFFRETCFFLCFLKFLLFFWKFREKMVSAASRLLPVCFPSASRLLPVCWPRFPSASRLLPVCFPFCASAQKNSQNMFFPLKNPKIEPNSQNTGKTIRNWKKTWKVGNYTILLIFA